MTSRQVDEYKDILAYFKIVPKRKLMDKLRSKIKYAKLKIRSIFKKLKLRKKSR